MVTIHYDFTNGSEKSYIEGKNLKDNFTINVLDFFTFDNKCEVKILKRDGGYILKSELLNNNTYTEKEIRLFHNIHKMLLANTFKWKYEKTH